MQDELDAPVFVTAEQIRRREFVASRRGYDAEQVRAYLDQLASQIEQMEEMLKEARLKAQSAAATPQRDDPYEAVSRRVAETMRTADEAANRIIAEARLEAEQILEPARSEADRVRIEAKQAAEAALSAADAAIREARERAATVLTRLDARREKALGQFEQFRERLLDAAKRMEEAIELRADALLDEEDEEAITAPIPTVVPAPEPEPPLDASTLDPTYADLFGSDLGGPLSGDDPLDVPSIPKFDMTWDDLDDEEPASGDGGKGPNGSNGSSKKR